MHQELVTTQDAVAQHGPKKAGEHAFALGDVLAGKLLCCLAQPDDWNDQVRVLLRQIFHQLIEVFVLSAHFSLELRNSDLKRQEVRS